MLAMKTPKAPTRSRRQALLAGAAIAIAMTALARAPKAHAQAFQGNPTVNTGNVTINRAPGQDNFTVNTAQAVIDWTTFDTGIGGGAINFLPVDAVAFFEANPSITDFTVLNRIVPTDQTRGISLNGRIDSRVGNLIGGNVWFYSPGGVIAGSTSVFDVGGLLLTTNAIDITNGLFGDGPDSTRGTIRFRGPANSQSAVEIQAGADISARNQALGNAYVALVAPRVVQRGTIDVSGSTAFVAAEQADLTIGFGNLFDINILVGTTAGTAIDHSGTTTGPSGGFGAGNSVYLATVAKNSAVTMLVSGTLGYTPATIATTDSTGNVVLSAGYDVTGSGIAATPDNANAANITLGNGTFTSNVVAHASNTLTGTATGSGINFAGSADLSGDASATLNIAAGGTLSVGTDLTLSSRRPNFGGQANLTANGAANIGRNLVIDASGAGPETLVPGVASNVTGGTASLTAAGGAIDIGGSAQVLAEATPGLGSFRSGDGTGGNAGVFTSGEGSIAIGTSQQQGTGSLIVSANGNSADRNGFFNLTANGGNGTGGTAQVNLGVGGLTATAVFVTASGSGGSGGFDNEQVISTGSAGSGAGGSAQFVAMAGGTATIDSLSVTAFGEAGGVSFDSAGAGATGGSARIEASGGQIDVAGLLLADAGAFASGGSTAGEARGGTITLAANGGGDIDAGSAGLNANAFGDFGDLNGGDAFAGTITVSADGGDIVLDDLFAGADARGGGGDTAGQAIGGTIGLQAVNGGRFALTGNSSISATGEGGSGDQGGDGSGGIVTLLASGGTIDLGEPAGETLEFFDILADGNGGRSFDGDPANGAGGTVDVVVEDGGTLRFDFLNIEASGRFFTNEGFFLVEPPEPSAGSGGVGSGGEVTVTASGGSMTGGFLSLVSDGTGGDAGPTGSGGDGVGGIVTFNLSGGSVELDGLDLSAEGQGGEGFFGDSEFASTAGGNGIGGTVAFNASAGSLTANSIFLEAQGDGGDGGLGFDVDGADGGDGYGGEVSFTLDGNADLIVDLIGVEAIGEGGRGGDVNYETGYGGEGFGCEEGCTFNDFAGDGGAGYGGSALVTIESGAIEVDTIEVIADGFGGEGGWSTDLFEADVDFANPGGGGAGGLGMGGDAAARLLLSEARIGSLNIGSEGNGGEGGLGMIGGDGGAGTGGAASLFVTDATVSLFTLSVDASADGGDGSDGLALAGGAGGDATGGTASIVSQGEAAQLILNSVALDADGDGGDGGHGGTAGGPLTPPQGGAGGQGGDGTGGAIEVLADLGLIAFPVGNQEGSFFGVSASGLGGDGGDGGDGTQAGPSGGVGGSGGGGQGGSILLDAAAGTITAPGELGLAAIGVGGEGGLGGFGPADPGNPEADPPRPPSDPIQSNGGAFGFGVGGAIHLRATDNNEIGASGLIDAGFTTLIASGLDPFEGLTGQAGSVTIDDFGADPDGSIRFIELIVLAQGSPGLGQPDSGLFLFSEDGAIQVANSVIAQVNGAVEIEADGTGGLAAGGSIDIFADGPVTITHANQTDPLAPTLDGANISIFSVGDLTAAPETLLHADFAIDLESVSGSTRGGTLVTDTGDIRVVAFGDAGFDDGTAGRRIVVEAGGDIDIGTATTLGVTENGYGVDSDILVFAGGMAEIDLADSAANLFVDADGGILIDRTDVADDATLLSDGGIVVATDLGVDGVVRALGADVDLTSLGELTFEESEATNGDIRVVTAQDLRANDFASAGDIFLTSSAGSVFLSDVTTQPQENEGEGQRESRIGGLSVGNPGPGDIVVDAAVDIVVEDIVDARRNLTMDAGQRIAINRLAHGTAIDLRSADISIDGEVGQIGRSTTTTSIVFANNDGETRTFIGGGDMQGGYSLSGAEMTRVFSGGDITIVAPGNSSPGAPADVVLGTMTVNGQTGTGERAGQLGNSGRFRVETPGHLTISGDVDFAGLGAEARVDLDADRQISLAAESGSLSLRGAGNALAGELQLTSSMIIAGTADAIADVASATSTDAINDRLGQSEGTPSDDGFFAARGIRVQASNGFFVQNTGASSGTTPNDRRGLTVGDGGLAIQTSGSSTRIVINGRQQTANGFTTGADFISLVQISTVESSNAQFDPRSTINGCLITGGGGQCGQIVEPPPPEPMLPVVDPSSSVRDLPLNEDVAPGDPGEGTAFPTALVTFADFESFGFEPLIDEPVTGAGNEDLWLAPEDEDDDEEE